MRPDVTHFGTGLLSTTIEGSGDTFRWRRQVGSSRVPAFSDTPVLAADVAGTRLRTGGSHPRCRTYHVGAGVDVAKLLLGPTTPSPAHCVEWMSSLAGALASVHGAARPHHTGPATSSRATTRLLGWLRGTDRSSLSQQLRSESRRRVGERRLRQLEHWADAPAAHPVVVHGAPGLGSLVPGPSGVDVLIGEDVCLGSASSDLGWVVGELFELALRLPSRAPWQAMTHHLLGRYPTAIDHREVAKWAAVRVAVHMHDHTLHHRRSLDDVEDFASIVALAVDVADAARKPVHPQEVLPC